MPVKFMLAVTAVAAATKGVTNVYSP